MRATNIYVVLIAMLLTACNHITQSMQHAQQTEQTQINEKLFEAKLSEMAYLLQMSNKQKAAFKPIYRNFCADMHSIWSNQQHFSKPHTSRDVAQMQKIYIGRQLKAQKVKLQYVDSFATVLNVQQMRKVWAAEQQIQRKIRIRQNQSIH